MKDYGVRKGTMGAVLLASTLLGPLSATACERHAAAAQPPAPTAAQAAPRDAHAPAPLDAHAHEALVQAGRALLAAKCSCDSKADCTCKKGQCKCAKCKGRHDVLEALQEQSGGQPVEPLARNDATAGVLL
ncbi:MAG TPA: metallothionein [Aggregicoccus sp.]|nr:metallothionein [Aggregicoccus sp.]